MILNSMNREDVLRKLKRSSTSMFSSLLTTKRKRSRLFGTIVFLLLTSLVLLVIEDVSSSNRVSAEVSFMGKSNNDINEKIENVDDDEEDGKTGEGNFGAIRNIVHDVDSYVYEHFIKHAGGARYSIPETSDGSDDDSDSDSDSDKKELSLDEQTDEVHREAKENSLHQAVKASKTEKKIVKPTGSLSSSTTTTTTQRRERTSSSGSSSGSKELACRLRECDQINAPFELGKQYSQNFVMSKQSTKTGNNVKVPKFLGIEGRQSRLSRGKSDQSVMHKQVKWSHLGQFPATAAKCLPEKDIVRQSFGKIKSCAVVGNGGGLLLKEYGEDIDSHDAVIRFNGGITKGFEKYVGKRTTYRLANFDHFAFHEDDVGSSSSSSSKSSISSNKSNDDEDNEGNEGDNITDNIEIAVLQHVTRPDALSKYGQLCEKGYYSKHGVPTVALHPDFHYFVLNTVARGGPSNGFYGTILAVEMCTHITLYGFQKNWKGTKVKYHYYDKIEPTDTQGARDSSEKSRFEQYVKEVNAYSRKCADSESCNDRRVDKHARDRDKIVFG